MKIIRISKVRGKSTGVNDYHYIAYIFDRYGELGIIPTVYRVKVKDLVHGHGNFKEEEVILEK